MQIYERKARYLSHIKFWGKRIHGVRCVSFSWNRSFQKQSHYKISCSVDPCVPWRCITKSRWGRCICNSILEQTLFLYSMFCLIWFDTNQLTHFITGTSKALRTQTNEKCHCYKRKLKVKLSLCFN